MIRKATAFVVTRAPEPMVLGFHHPPAGLQFPAGTVERDESFLNAARREAREETSVTSMTIGRVIALEHQRLRPDEGIVLENIACPAGATQNRRHSFLRGHKVKVISEADGVANICQEEWDLTRDPPRVAIRAAGTVPTESVTRSVCRGFACFRFLGEPQLKPWSCMADGHELIIEWTPLATTQKFAFTQAEWLQRFQSTMRSICQNEL